jgi:hypothetical protein
MKRLRDPSIHLRTCFSNKSISEHSHHLRDLETPRPPIWSISSCSRIQVRRKTCWLLVVYRSPWDTCSRSGGQGHLDNLLDNWKPQWRWIHGRRPYQSSSRTQRNPVETVLHCLEQNGKMKHPWGNVERSTDG